MKKLSYFLALTIVFSGVLLSSCGEDEGPGGTSGADGSTHNAGRNCIGCHDLKYAGTVYTDATGTTPASSVTVIVTEADGTQRSMVSDQSGNFYSDQGNPAGGYTVTVQGNSVNMARTVTSGGCNSSGCHTGDTVPRIYQN